LGGVTRYLALLYGYRAAFAKIFVAACLSELFYLTVPFVSRHMIDGVLLASDISLVTKRSLLTTLGLTLFAALIIAELIDFWRRIYTVRTNGHFVRALRARLYLHLLHLPLSNIYNLKTGGIVSRLTSDAESLTGILQMALISPSVALLRIVLTFVILFHWHLPLALVVMGLLPPLVYISLIYILKVRPIYRSISNDRSEQDARTSEIFTGIRAIKAYGMQLSERKRYNAVQTTMMRKSIKASLVESFVDGIWNFLIPITALAILVVGGFYFLAGHMTIGNLFAFQMYSGMLLYPVWRMVSSLSQIQKSLASLERVTDLLTMNRENVEGKLQAPERIGSLELKKLSFAYTSDKPVIKNISLALEPSHIYALIGESGIGKTTLVDLICRFYTPDAGAILANGSDISEFELQSWRSRIALVTQEAILFDGTVRENLFAGTGYEAPENLNAILAAADANDFISELPQGLDTLIGERGLKLSGGQKHRLTLARALLRGAPILVLDEATAHLDSLSERRIRRNLNQIKRGRIVIIVTHRLSTVSHADEIFVLGKNGGVAARGSHKQLLRSSAAYRRLWLAQ